MARRRRGNRGTFGGVEKIDASPETIGKAIMGAIDIPVLKDGKRVAKPPVDGEAAKLLKKQEDEAKAKARAEEEEKRKAQARQWRTTT